ncbi:unnamed protein product [Lactuca saligna]|uniref:Uncharacterized protein n=1 Tax=Lactuca saligna TaxID=75948 RepID=A0AA36EQ82_LACSI|nr:unnamed protein product [Lactuca saligna]
MAEDADTIIDEEEVDLEDDDLVSIDDVDSILEDGLKAEHVEDDEVISLKRNFNDQFLNKLCPIQNNNLVEEDHNVIQPIYPRHDHTQEWNEMKPRLGMKYSITTELKYSLSCYVVANGNDLQYEKNDKRLHTILPPLRRRLPGRPCVKRKRDQAERDLSGHTRHTVSRAGIPLRCTICHQTGHNKATCPSKPTPALSTASPSQLTPAPSTAGPSQSTPAPVKRTPVNKALMKKAHVKRSPMKKVPLNDVGRVRKFEK